MSVVNKYEKIDTKPIIDMLITSENNSLNNIVKVVIESVEDFKITGDEKKALCVVIITEYVNTMQDDDYKTILFSSLETGIISDLIDLVILASQNKLKLNKKTILKMLINYFKCCINFASKKLED